MTGRRADGPEIALVCRHFGRNLAAMRRRSDLSQAATAERSGLHRTEISLLERGLRMPRLSTLVQVAAGVDGEPCDLLDGMAWRLDRRHLHDAEVPPGCFELKVLSKGKVT